MSVLGQDILAVELIRDFEKLRGDRGILDSHCQEIAERVLPMDSDYFKSAGHTTKGDKRNTEIFDSTAVVALTRFAAILDSLLTPRNQTWHKLKVSDDSLAKSKRVRLYFEDVNRILFKHRYAPKANFSSQNQMNYKSLGAYGTGSMFIDELRSEPGLRYRAIHLSGLYIAENHQGIVDKVHRFFKMTARQAFQKWGSALSEDIQKDAVKTPEKEFEFLHSIRPRKNIDFDRRDFRGMPIEAFYIELKGKIVLEEEGFNTFPYAISRYEQALNEAYGRSPAMDVLPAIKTLNEEKKTVLKQGHRAVDPIILAHDDGVIDTFNLLPGSVNYGAVNKDGRPLIHTLPTGNIVVGKDLMQEERAIINDAFLVTLFQILVDSPAMTATEVLERTREKGILLAPTVGRQQSEYLGPTVERELDLLSRQMLLPKQPPELVEASGEYKIEYDSPLSRAQRAEEATGALHTLDSVLNIVQSTGDSSHLDHFEFDVMIPEMADIRGMPERWIKSPQKLALIRAQRAQEQQIQTAIQAAPGVAALSNAASKQKVG